MTIAIIDGDVLCYQACRARWEKKAKIQNGIAYISLNSQGQRVPLEWTKEEDRQYLEESWENLQQDLTNLVSKIYCDDYLMAVKGSQNFRNFLYPEYKLNRHADPNKQNHFVPVLRQLAVAQDLAVPSDGREADDLMRIWAEECIAIGQDYIICSIDKDLRCIPGRHYLMHKEELIEISQEEAIRHYYEQLLKGDPTDNIPGVPRVGVVKAKKILESATTEQEFQERVVEQYLIAYGENDWKDYLLSNGKMIYLQKNKDDYFKINNWPIIRELFGGI